MKPRAGRVDFVTETEAVAQMRGDIAYWLVEDDSQRREVEVKSYAVKRGAEISINVVEGTFDQIDRSSSESLLCQQNVVPELGLKPNALLLKLT